MNTKGLLDQLLSSGQRMLQEQGLGGDRQRQGSRPQPQDTGDTTGALGDLASRFGGLGGGTLAGGAIGLLLGNKRLRKFAGKAGMYGGVAALGVLAYRAYTDWQKQQQGPAASREPRTIDRVSGGEAEEQGQAILKALVGAAKADGHIDDRERQLIEGEIAKVDSDRDLQAWLDGELRKPLDPADVAAAASSEEVASEMYLASRLVVDDESYMERAYLDELVRRMNLDPELRRHLDREMENASRVNREAPSS